jgi:uncharacterized protein YlxW (UPF0749 family)
LKHSKTLSLTLICMLLGVAIAWQYKSVYNNNKTVSVQSATLEDLKDKLLIEKKNNDELRARNDELNVELSKFESAQGNIELYEKNLKAEVEKANIVAGLTSVKGNGVIITIKNTDFGIVQSSQILKLVNALKAAEAKAISVNKERIIAMTEISDAGNVIIINGMPMSVDEPFVIKAIFEPLKLDNAVKMIGYILDDFRNNYLDLTIEKDKSVIIPKVEENRPNLANDLLKTEK